MLVTTIGLAAYSRADIPEGRRQPFYLYVDEFQSFTTYRLSPAYCPKLENSNLVSALLISFSIRLMLMCVMRSWGTSAPLSTSGSAPKTPLFLVKEFQPSGLEAVDLLNLPNHHVYVKLLIDGQPSKPFSAVRCDHTSQPRCCENKVAKASDATCPRNRCHHL